MMYTFAVKVIADERVLGNLGDLAKRLGITVCALREDHQMLDGYVDPDVLVVGVRTRLEDERNLQDKIG